MNAKSKAREVRPEVQLELPVSTDVVRMVAPRGLPSGSFSDPRCRRVALDFSQCKKMTEDGHEQETDLKVILKRHGIKSAAQVNTAQVISSMHFGDGRFPDFQTAQNAVVRATEAFEALPGSLRARFRNDPNSFIQFVSDPINRDAMSQLGISTAHLPAVPKAPPAGVQAPLAPDAGAPKAP